MKRGERGYVLLAVLVLLLTIGAAWLVGGITSGNTEQRETVQTNQALVTAKEALLAYALAENNSPGSLPCPVTETGTTAVSGCSTSPKAFPPTGTTVKIIGRFPWRSLGVEAPKNGSGDCVWLLLYMPMRNRVATVNRSEFPINSATFTSNDQSHSLWFQNQSYPAVLVSPPPAQAGQNRVWNSDSTCSAGLVSNYLDAITSDPTSTEIAQKIDVLPVSINELLRPILKRVLEPASQSCARKLLAIYPSSASLLSGIRDEDLSRSALVDPLDLALGGCDQVDKCAQELEKVGLDLFNYDVSKEVTLTPEEKETIQNWCSLYRDTADAVLTAGTCPTTTKSADTSPNTPPFWLCHNGWYDHISLDKSTNTLSVSLKTSPPFTCSSRLADGIIQCK